MNILFALSSFYPDYKAGTETYVLNISKELLKMGYMVSVIIPAIGKKSYTYEYDGIKVYAFHVPQKISTKELNGLEKPSGICEFETILKEINPDFFHLHSLSRSLHAEHVKVANKLGIKTIFTAHLGNTFCVKGDLMLFDKKQCDGIAKKQRCLACFIKYKKGFSIRKSKIMAGIINSFVVNTPLTFIFPAFHIVKNKIQQLSVLNKYCHLNIAIADWLKKVFELNGFASTANIKQGIDIQFIKEKQSKFIENRIRLYFVGRMHPDKGVHLLLDALEQIEIDKFDLTVITIPFEDEIQYYHEIKNKFQHLGFTNWYENLNQQEVSEKLNKADLLVLPSLANEAAPLVILEAFAQKIPVIGSDYVAIKEMIHHNINGLLFKNGKVLSLKEQLHRLINEPELLYKLSQNIGSIRTFNQIAQDLDKVYRKI